MDGQPRRGGVVVTGASSGIGLACARRLDRHGFRVFAGVLPGEDDRRLRDEASERLRVVDLDVTDSTSIAKAADAITAEVGEVGLVGLVNNAGISVLGPLEFLPVEALREQFEVNVIGQIAVTQAFLPLLRQGRGRVVMIGSADRLATDPPYRPVCRLQERPADPHGGAARGATSLGHSGLDCHPR